MKQTKWYVLLAFVGGLWLMLTACNLSDMFDPQLAVSTPEIPATLQPEAVKTIPDTRVTLQAKGCASDTNIDLMNKTQSIVQKRLIGLGVSNIQVKIQDACQLVIDLPAPKNLTQTLDLIVHTGRLEFVDTGKDFYTEGTLLRTTGNPTPTLTLSNTQAMTIPDKIYRTVVTGSDLLPDELKVVLGGMNSQQPEVTFQLEPATTQKFKEFTTRAVGSYLCIVLDNRVASCPSVNSPIPDGKGVITVGEGGINEANQLVNLLRFGTLPYELEVIQTEALPTESESKP